MNDTHPEIERIWIKMLREAGPQHRATMMSDLTNQALWRSRRAIQRVHPDLSDLEQRLLFIQVHYGRDLAERVCHYVESRRGLNESAP